jgi:hypothetical protein
VRHNAALLGVRLEALLISLFSPARSMADGMVFPFPAHAIAAPANGRRKTAGSAPAVSHDPGSLRA